jgi:hypothetical protein
MNKILFIVDNNNTIYFAFLMTYRKRKKQTYIKVISVRLSKTFLNILNAGKYTDKIKVREIHFACKRKIRVALSTYKHCSREEIN